MNKLTKKNIAFLVVMFIAVVVIIWQVFFVKTPAQNVLSVELLNSDTMIATTSGVEEILFSQEAEHGTFCVCRANDGSLMIVYLMKDDDGNYNVKMRGSVSPDNLAADAQQAESDTYPLEKVTSYYNVFLNTSNTQEVQHNGKTFKVNTFDYSYNSNDYTIGFWCYDVGIQ